MLFHLFSFTILPSVLDASGIKDKLLLVPALKACDTWGRLICSHPTIEQEWMWFSVTVREDSNKWKWGKGRGLGDTKSLSRSTKENLKKSTVKAAMKSKSVAKVLITQFKFIYEFLKLGRSFKLTYVSSDLSPSMAYIQAASVWKDGKSDTACCVGWVKKDDSESGMQADGQICLEGGSSAVWWCSTKDQTTGHRTELTPEAVHYQGGQQIYCKGFVTNNYAGSTYIIQKIWIQSDWSPFCLKLFVSSSNSGPSVAWQQDPLWPGLSFLLRLGVSPLPLAPVSPAMGTIS